MFLVICERNTVLNGKYTKYEKFVKPKVSKQYNIYLYVHLSSSLYCK